MNFKMTKAAATRLCVAALAKTLARPSPRSSSSGEGQGRTVLHSLEVTASAACR
jgi:hypothetical protein